MTNHQIDMRARAAEIDAARLEERRKVAEDCIIAASKFITVKWRREAMAEEIRAKYIHDSTGH